MKNIILFIAFATTLNIGFSQSNDMFFEKADHFFETYVENGRVDYKSISTDGKLELSNLIDILANHDYSEQIEKAYLINAYNIFVIDQVVEHYPISSPMDVPGFFENKNAILNGQLISLNTLENDLLRKVYKDARLHFVLVCGAVGCPPITNFAYVPDELDNQLDSQTTLALNNSEFLYVNSEEKSVYLSEIFKWYATDFGKTNKEALIYINQFSKKQYPLDSKIKYYPYNWSLNKMVTISDIPIASEIDPINSSLSPGGQTFNAGTLLRKGQFDFTLFNTMYTQTKSNWQGVDFTGFRETFNTHLIQITYGSSKNKRINLGMDINFKSSGSSVDSTISGISNSFSYKNTDSSRVGITSLGLRLKVQPFQKTPNFTLQSILLAPTIKFAEGNPTLYWADWERLTWWNQFFYTKSFNKFQLFTEIDLLFRLKIYNNQINTLDVPLSAFFSYFPNNKITFYVMSQHVPRFTRPKANSNDWVIPANYTASGFGFKYQFNRSLNLELLYTNFWRGKNSGLGSTFNVGIKYITK